jgi:hypothetical protein
MDGENATLVTSQKVIDEIADNGVRFVAKLGHDPADKRAAASMPLEIDGPVKVSCAADFCPAVGSTGLFRPDFDEAELPLQLGIAHDLVAQRAATARNHLDHRLHSVVRFDGNSVFATGVCGARTAVVARTIGTRISNLYGWRSSTPVRGNTPDRMSGSHTGHRPVFHGYSVRNIT